MYQPLPTASLPHALTVAHQGLCRALDLGIQEFNKEHRRFSNSREVCLAVARFVEEFRRRPTWWAELQRRAGFVESSCGSQSEYRRAMGAAWKAYREHPKKPFGPELLMERQYFSRLRKAISPPILVAQVLDICRYLEELIRMGLLGLRVRAAFENWLHQCRLIQREAERLEADGCHYLYHVYQAANPNPSERSECRRAELASETFFGGARLEPMLVAADSLVAWAAGNLAGGPSGDDSVVEAVQADPQKSVRRTGLTSQEFNVLARNYLREHATPERQVKARELKGFLMEKNPAGTCSLKTIYRLPAWRAYQDELGLQGEKGKKKKLKAVAFADKVEATVGETDSELRRLIEDQGTDVEPSPLEDDPPDGPPRRVRCRKQV